MSLKQVDISHKPVRKTLIYIPTCTNFTRAVMDTRYRYEINKHLANAMRYTLPVNHIHLKLEREEPKLFLEAVKALSSYEGYLVIEVTKTTRRPWERQPVTDITTEPLMAQRELTNNYKELLALLRDENFKPRHIVVVGDAHSEQMTFLNNIMIVDGVGGVAVMRGCPSPIAPATDK